MRNRCEAVTQPSTYSSAHRCLKKSAKRREGRRLCTHHWRALESMPHPKPGLN